MRKRGDVRSRTAWNTLVALTLVAVFLHVVMEWLFFVTKPSFLSALGTADKLWLPGTASSPLLAAALLLLALLSLPAWIAPGGRAERIAHAVARAVPAAILAATCLLLLDNFTHTLFGWGSASLQGAARALVALLYAVLVGLLVRSVASWGGSLATSRRGRRTLGAGAAAILVYAGTALLLQGGGDRTRASGGGGLAGQETERPNILLIGSDGVDADHMSVYGAPRATTPLLESLARESLVFDNAFPNASSTGGSVTSILTGRLPTRTGVIYPPDIARGGSAYLHLPALLKQRGYRTGQFTIRWYADAIDLNLQGSFDWANFRSTAQPEGTLVLEDHLGQSSTYFLGLLRERLGERLLFTRARRERPDPFREVTEDTSPGHRDDQRISALLSFIASSDEPFFAHVHLMGTHGARFFPRQAVFSVGREQDADWIDDFYDDAVLDFDRYLEEVVTFLRQRGLLERTILVVYSDHGQKYLTAQRVPLLFRFPGAARRGRVSTLVQNLDIAPTLVDALGGDVPDWMEGRSLLAGTIEPCRPILSAIVNSEIISHQGNWWFSTPRPPFFTLGTLAVITGQRTSALDVIRGRLGQAAVATAGGAGAECSAFDPEQARSFLIGHLRESGYDVSSLARPAG
jgi:arylsulfatase A-like enzyme